MHRGQSIRGSGCRVARQPVAHHGCMAPFRRALSIRPVQGLVPACTQADAQAHAPGDPGHVPSGAVRLDDAAPPQQPPRNEPVAQQPSGTAEAQPSGTAARQQGGLQGTAVAQQGRAVGQHSGAAAQQRSTVGQRVYSAKQQASLLGRLKAVKHPQGLDVLLPECDQALTRATGSQEFLAVWYALANALFHRTSSASNPAADEQLVFTATATALRDHLGTAIAHCNQPQQLRQCVRTYNNIHSTYRQPFTDVQREALASKLSDPRFLLVVRPEPQAACELALEIVRAGRQRELPGALPRKFVLEVFRTGEVTEPQHERLRYDLLTHNSRQFSLMAPRAASTSPRTTTTAYSWGGRREAPEDIPDARDEVVEEDWATLGRLTASDAVGQQGRAAEQQGGAAEQQGGASGQQGEAAAGNKGGAAAQQDGAAGQQGGAVVQEAIPPSESQHKLVTSLQDLEALLPQCDRTLATAADNPEEFFAMWNELAAILSHRASSAPPSAPSADEQRCLTAMATVLRNHSGTAITHCQGPKQLGQYLTQYCNITSTFRQPFGDAQREALASKLVEPRFLHAMQSDPEASTALVEALLKAGSMRVRPGLLPTNFAVALLRLPGLDEYQRNSLKRDLLHHNRLSTDDGRPGSQPSDATKADQQGGAAEQQGGATEQQGGSAGQQGGAAEHGRAEQQGVAAAGPQGGAAVQHGGPAVSELQGRLQAASSLQELEALLPECDQALTMAADNVREFYAVWGVLADKHFQSTSNTHASSTASADDQRCLTAMASLVLDHASTAITYCQGPYFLRCSMRKIVGIYKSNRAHAVHPQVFDDPQRQALAARLSDPQFLLEMHVDSHAAMMLVGSLLRAGRARRLPGPFPQAFMAELLDARGMSDEDREQFELDMREHNRRESLLHLKEGVGTAVPMHGSQGREDDSHTRASRQPGPEDSTHAQGVGLAGDVQEGSAPQAHATDHARQDPDQPAGAAGQPGGSARQPGGSAGQPGGAAGQPVSAAEQPGGSVGQQVGTAVQQSSSDFIVTLYQLESINSLQELEALLPECDQALAMAAPSGQVRRMWNKLASRAFEHSTPPAAYQYGPQQTTADQSGPEQTAADHSDPQQTPSGPPAGSADEQRCLAAMATVMRDHISTAITLCWNPKQLTECLRTYNHLISNDHRQPFGDVQRLALATKLSDPHFLLEVQLDARAAALLVAEVVRAGHNRVQPGPLPRDFVVDVLQAPGLTEQQREQLKRSMLVHNWHQSRPLQAGTGESGKHPTSSDITRHEAQRRGEAGNARTQAEAADQVAVRQGRAAAPKQGGATAAPKQGGATAAQRGGAAARQQGGAAATAAAAAAQQTEATVSDLRGRLQSVNSLEELEALLPECNQALTKAAASASPFLRLWNDLAYLLKLHQERAATPDDQRCLTAMASLIRDHFTTTINHCQGPWDLTKRLHRLDRVSSAYRQPFSNPQRRALAAKLRDPGFLFEVQLESEAAVDLVAAMVRAGRCDWQPGVIPSAYANEVVRLPGLEEEVRERIQQDVAAHNVHQSRLLASDRKKAAAATQHRGDGNDNDSDDTLAGANARAPSNTDPRRPPARSFVGSSNGLAAPRDARRAPTGRDRTRDLSPAATALSADTEPGPAAPRSAPGMVRRLLFPKRDDPGLSPAPAAQQDAPQQAAPVAKQGAMQQDTRIVHGEKYGDQWGEQGDWYTGGSSTRAAVRGAVQGKRDAEGPSKTGGVPGRPATTSADAQQDVQQRAGPGKSRKHHRKASLASPLTP